MLSLIFFIIIIIFFFAIPGVAHAQPAGQLVGSIYDRTGGVLVGARVTVRDPVGRQGRSDAAGRFEFRDLPPGDYDLSTAFEGFQSVQRAVRIHPGERLSVTLAMDVAAFGETVVTAARVGERNIQSTAMAAWSYEGGLKTGLMNGRARLDVAAFRMDYRTCRCSRQSPSACSTSEMPQRRL